MSFTLLVNSACIIVGIVRRHSFQPLWTGSNSSGKYYRLQTNCKRALLYTALACVVLVTNNISLMAWYCIVAKCASEVRDHWEIGEGMGFAFAFPIAFADWFCDYDVGMGENTTYCCHIFTTKLGSAKTMHKIVQKWPHYVPPLFIIEVLRRKKLQSVVPRFGWTARLLQGLAKKSSSAVTRMPRYPLSWPRVWWAGEVICKRELWSEESVIPNPRVHASAFGTKFLYIAPHQRQIVARLEKTAGDTTASNKINHITTKMCSQEYVSSCGTRHLQSMGELHLPPCLG